MLVQGSAAPACVHRPPDSDSLALDQSYPRPQRQLDLATDKPLHVLHRDCSAVDAAEGEVGDAPGLSLRRLSLAAHGSGLSPTSDISKSDSTPSLRKAAAPHARAGRDGSDAQQLAPSEDDEDDDSDGDGAVRQTEQRTAVGDLSSNWVSKLQTLPFQSKQRPRSSPRSPSTTPSLAHAPAASLTPASVTPPRQSAQQARPSFAANSFASLQQVPGLPTIPASPLSPPPFGRSHTSPQLNPTILSDSPISPLPGISLFDSSGPQVTTQVAWPKHHRSMSAPQLSLAIPAVALAPLAPAGPLLSPVVVQPASNQSSTRLGSIQKLFYSLKEFFESEEAYLDVLRALVRVYLRTLAFLPSLSDAEKAIIIRNSEELLRVHEDLAAHFEEIGLATYLHSTQRAPETVAEEQQLIGMSSKMAKALMDLIPGFSAYEQYCAKQTEATDLVRNLAKRPEWEAYERLCARSASAGDQTPLAAIAASPFFASTPTLVGSPPTSPTTPVSPSAIRGSLELSPGRRDTAYSRSRLRFADHSIAPVQRVCRYPLLLAAVLKHVPDGNDRDAVETVWDAFKRVCEGVDEAKRAREGELRTKTVASRMEFLAPTSSAFCNILGPTLLVGTLHFLHRTASHEPLRIKYYGCFLYQTHLVVCKIRRRLSYEPREWLPLRQFDLTSIEEGEGLLPHSFRMSHQEHIFEFGATCEPEKAIWLSRLQDARKHALTVWKVRPADSTEVDESIISSVIFAPTAHRNHSRASSFASIGTPHSDEAHPFDYAPVPTTTANTVSKSSRLSATASALLGRTPAVQRAAIDLRLSDGVFSEELTAARAQAMREGSSLTLSRATSSSARGQTQPKRSMTAQAQASLKALGWDKRRMSSHELATSPASELRSAPVGFDASVGVVFSGNPDPRSIIRKTKSTHGRPRLPDIDTKLSAAIKRGGVRSASVIRRAASHSDLVTPAPKTPIVPSAVSANADVERNNSVSSTSSSSGTGTNSSSSHGVTYASVYSVETPPPSVPPSPDCLPLDLEHLHAHLPQTNMVTSQPQSLMTSAAKIKRRRSLFGAEALASPRSPPDDAAEAGTSSIHRRASTKLGKFFSKRVQSSPTLSNLFAHATSGSSAASSTLSLSAPDTTAASRSAVAATASASTPSLELPPTVDPTSLPDDHSSASGSGASSPEYLTYPRPSSKARPMSRTSLESVRSSNVPLAPETTSASSSTTSLVAASRSKSKRSLFKLTPIA
ncbi:hypothetical protein OIV83_002445 [Microbotryomycetes sp. JL201]|nr:hypothetical protein OIV83_002445 [Microbotryomycetes sp. JL201]